MANPEVSISMDKPESVVFNMESERIIEPEREIRSKSTTESVLSALAIIFLILTFPISIFAAIKICYEYERALIFCLGKLKHKEVKGPGVFFILPFIETFVRIDLRTVSFVVPQQEVLSKDSVTVQVDAVVYFKKDDPISSVINIEDAAGSTKLLAQSTLRNMLGTKTLSEMLQQREHIANQMQEATREARAKIIAAEGEQQSSEALKRAAQVISEAPAALQLRFLQTLSSISAEHNSTIVFPFPIDMCNVFLKNSENNKNKASVAQE